MSTDAPQSKFEKAASAFLFILLAAVGWIPFIHATWREPYADPPFLFISAGLGLVSASMVYDAAERLIDQGRGIYTAAIFFSFAPVGALISDSALLPMTSLLFIVASVNWLAVRAEGRNRGFNLFIIGSLLFVCGFLFSFLALCLVFFFAVWLAVRSSDKKYILSLIFLALFFIGAALRTTVELGIPLILELPAQENVHPARLALMQLPWLLWIIPLAYFSLQKSKLPNWQLGGVLTLVVVYLVSASMKIDPMITGAISAPALSLCITDLLFRWFALKRKDSTLLYVLPVLLAATAMLILVAARFVEIDWFDKLSRNQAVAAMFLFILAVVFTIRKLPRWNFGVSVALGLLAGSLWWVRKGLLEMDDPLTQEAESEFIFFNYIPVLIVAFIVIMKRLYGRRLPRIDLQQEASCQFTEANLRLFNNVRRREWEGELVDIASMKKGDYSFLIFGDVTGGEFPVSSRRGGYFVYRDLVEEIEKQQADFVISVGDLSTHAGTMAYRRLRQILRHIPVPFAVSPGNHDLVSGDEYLPHYFQSLFGADNSAFILGPVKYILLNNGWGSLKDEQFEWLEKVLPRDDEQFTFVFCHKPPIDPREHEFYGMEWREHAERLHELFKQHNVTAVFSGHIHALLKHEQDGVIYIISGGGGSKLDDKEAVHHYLRADVSDNSIRLRALPIRKRGEGGDAIPLMELTFTSSRWS